jgi:hypothetical protein
VRLFSAVLPALPGIPAGLKTYAPWPVWRGSIRAVALFVPLARKTARGWWHEAKDWLKPLRWEIANGKRLVVITGWKLIAVYDALVDHLNSATGQCDPSHAEIARCAGICARTVAHALKLLRDLGVLSWVRRCAEDRGEDGQYRLRQISNAYTLSPPSHWRGYRAPPPPPAPEAGTWGDHPPLPDSLGAELALRTFPDDPFAAALATAEFARGNYWVATISKKSPESRESLRPNPPEPADNDIEALKRWHLQRLLGPDKPG